MLYLFKITDYNRINLLDALVQYIRSEIYYIGFTPKNQTLNKYLSQILRLAQPSQPRHTIMIKLASRIETDKITPTPSFVAECLSNRLLFHH